MSSNTANVSNTSTSSVQNVSNSSYCPTNYLVAPLGSEYDNNNIYFPNSQSTIPNTSSTVFVGNRLCLGPSNASFKFSNGKFAVDTSKQIVCPMGTPLKSQSGNYYCVVDMDKY